MGCAPAIGLAMGGARSDPHQPPPAGDNRKRRVRAALEVRRRSARSALYVILASSGSCMFARRSRRVGRGRRKEQQAQACQTQADSFKVFEDRQADLEARQATADKALAGRMEWSKLLNELALVLPSDAWLTSARGGRERRSHDDGGTCRRRSRRHAARPASSRSRSCSSTWPTSSSSRTCGSTASTKAEYRAQPRHQRSRRRRRHHSRLPHRARSASAPAPPSTARRRDRMKTPMKLSPRDQMIVAGRRIVIVAVAFIVLLDRAPVRQLSAARAPTCKAPRTRHRRREPAARRDVRRRSSRRRQTQAQLTRLDNQFPDAPEMAALIIELQDTANDAGVDFAKLSPSEPSGCREGYQKMPLSSQVTGGGTTHRLPAAAERAGARGARARRSTVAPERRLGERPTGAPDVENAVRSQPRGVQSRAPPGAPSPAAVGEERGMVDDMALIIGSAERPEIGTGAAPRPQGRVTASSRLERKIVSSWRRVVGLLVVVGLVGASCCSPSAVRGEQATVTPMNAEVETAPPAAASLVGRRARAPQATRGRPACTNKDVSRRATRSSPSSSRCRR